MGLLDVCSSYLTLFVNHYFWKDEMCTTNSFTFLCVTTAVPPFYSCVVFHRRTTPQFIYPFYGWVTWLFRLAVLNKVALNTLIHYFGGHKPYSVLLSINKLGNRIPIL